VDEAGSQAVFSFGFAFLSSYLAIGAVLLPTRSFYAVFLEVIHI